MTLFDGKPLTEEEIAERDVCRCGDIRGEHGFDMAVTARVAERHTAYHRAFPSRECGDQCSFDPSVVCRRCGCVEFRRNDAVL